MFGRESEVRSRDGSGTCSIRTPSNRTRRLFPTVSGVSLRDTTNPRGQFLNHILTDWTGVAIALRNNKLLVLANLPHPFQFMSTDWLRTGVDDDDLSCRVLNARAGTCFDTLRFAVSSKLDLWIVPREIDRNFIRLIGRTIIHDHNFEFTNEIRQYFQQFDDTCCESAFGVTNRQDDTKRLWAERLGTAVHKVAPGGQFRSCRIGRMAYVSSVCYVSH